MNVLPWMEHKAMLRCLLSLLFLSMLPAWSLENLSCKIWAVNQSFSLWQPWENSYMFKMDNMEKKSLDEDFHLASCSPILKFVSRWQNKTNDLTGSSHRPARWRSLHSEWKDYIQDMQWTRPHSCSPTGWRFSSRTQRPSLRGRLKDFTTCHE